MTIVDCHCPDDIEELNGPVAGWRDGGGLMSTLRHHYRAREGVPFLRWLNDTAEREWHHTEDDSGCFWVWYITVSRVGRTMFRDLARLREDRYEVEMAPTEGGIRVAIDERYVGI